MKDRIQRASSTGIVRYPALRLIAGFVLLIGGGILALPGIPGPGIVIAAIGLGLLSDHFPWAKRTLEWGKRKLRWITRMKSR